MCSRKSSTGPLNDQSQSSLGLAYFFFKDNFGPSISNDPHTVN